MSMWVWQETVRGRGIHCAIHRHGVKVLDQNPVFYSAKHGFVVCWCPLSIYVSSYSRRVFLSDIARRCKAFCVSKLR